MKYCPSVSYKKLLTTHGDIAHMEYAILRNNMRVGLNQEACPGFGNAMAEAVILSVSTPKHLQQHLNLLNDYTYDDEMNMNFLYRMVRDKGHIYFFGIFFSFFIFFLSFSGCPCFTLNTHLFGSRETMD